jgi:choline kinase
MKVVIQSGGKGTRLRPYTMIRPKPLMPVGNKLVLELLINWLRYNRASEHNDVWKCVSMADAFSKGPGLAGELQRQN